MNNVFKSEIIANEDNLELVNKISQSLSEIRRKMPEGSRGFDLSNLEALAASTALKLESVQRDYDEFTTKKAALEAVIRENRVAIKSVEAVHTESAEEVLARIGFDKSVIDNAFYRIEKLVNRSRRNGYFKSSEQTDVYAEMNSIADYLARFDMVENRHLAEFADLHCKKLFDHNFEITKDYVRHFSIK